MGQVTRVEMHQISYFLQVAQTLNVTRAAEELHVSQPALSRQIKLLEDELGTLLFERLPQGLKLTPAGLALLPHLAAILARIEQTAEIVRPFATGQKGRLVIGATPGLAVGFLPPVLAAYLRRFPEAETVVQVRSTSAELLRQLHEGEIDLALCGGAAPEFGRVLLFDEALVAVVPERLGQAVGEAILLAELERLPMIATPPACTVRQLLPDRLSKAAEVDQLNTALQFASQGVGIAVVPESMARAGAGVRVLPLRPELRHRVWAHWRPAGALWAEHPLIQAITAETSEDLDG